MSPTLAYRTIYTDECASCFSHRKDEHIIDICITCLSPGCIKHSKQHCDRVSHPFVLRISQNKNEENKQNDIKEDNVEQNHEDDVQEVYCLKCEKVLDPIKFQQVIELVQGMTVPRNTGTNVQTWDLETRPCPHTATLVQTNSKKIVDKALAQCNDCDLNLNLWLCLSCGSLGCGRQNFDGTGGKGHAKRHFEKTGHAVAVKLGTITPDGDASVHCYKCDDEVEDDDLGEHLANFGIHIENLKKTEKKVDEMNIEANETINWKTIVGAKNILIPLHGKGFTGISGVLSDSSSILQLVFTMKEFQERYSKEGHKHLETCKNYGPDCFECQISKIARVLCGDEEDDKVYEEGIKLRMFRTIMQRKFPELSQGMQQDEIRYLDCLFRMMQETDRKANRQDITEIFNFELLTKHTCQQCQGYKVNELGTCTYSNLVLDIPESENFREESNYIFPNRPPFRIPLVDFKDCLSALHKDFSSSYCSRCEKNSVFENGLHFKTWPKYLIFMIERRTMVNWVPSKDLSEIFFDSETQDFSRFKVPDMDPAMILKEEPKDEISPIEANVKMFVAMGFKEDLARKVLEKKKGNVEDAMNWLLGNNSEDKEEEPGNVEKVEVEDIRSYNYQLKAAIVHFGQSFTLGQYACYAKKEGKWVSYNGEKVAESLDPRLEKGVLYLFEKCSV